MESSEQAIVGSATPTSPPCLPSLDLANLATACDLTPALVTSCAEAARLVLFEMKHAVPPPPTTAKLHYQDKIIPIHLVWVEPDSACSARS